MPQRSTIRLPSGENAGSLAGAEVACELHGVAALDLLHPQIHGIAGRAVRYVRHELAVARDGGKQARAGIGGQAATRQSSGAGADGRARQTRIR